MSEGRRRRGGKRGARVGAGSVVGDRYRVVSTLGEGGMGQVLLVEHLELPKRFALKLIRPDRWDETLEARFRREAQALARVTTPRVAQVTDFGVDEVLGPYFVMEYVEGTTLSDLLRDEGTLEPGRALEIAIGLAEALRDVHAAGIVHRDVKPGNVSVGAGPVEVRLMDFGLAASAEQYAESRITQSRAVVGSVPYMAPEQFHGAPPSVQMDLWALGVVLYEMLYGRPPFDADSTAALIHQILTQELPLAPRAAPALEPVFARLLAKEPEARAASADEAIEVLEEALAAPRAQWESGASRDTVEAARVEPSSGPSTDPVPTPPPMARPWVAVLAGAALLIAGVGALGWKLAHPPEVVAVPVERAAAPPQARVIAPASEREGGADREDVTGESAPDEPSAAQGAEAGDAARAAVAEPAPRVIPRSGRGRGRAAASDEPPAQDDVRAPSPAGERRGGGAWTGGIIESPLD
ncbi:MAG: protein kinase [Sandaracinaceae bacterium]|nr:protein kinase [Sandaracinaceae bacterium]